MRNKNDERYGQRYDERYDERYDQRHSHRRPHRKNRLTRLFVKTFFITVVFLGVLFSAGWLTLRNAVKPPTIPEVNAESNQPTQQTADEPHSNAAYFVPVAEPEDALIGNNMSAPDRFTTADRKMLFYTFLIFGLDGGVNTDTIMVAAYDGVARKAYVIGIPRDSKVNVKRNLKKINAAYPVGTLDGGGMEGGIEQLQREIKTIIGFVPDYYICVDFKAFKEIVDAVNGVEVDVPFNMVYDDPAQNLHINIRKGLQTLNGEDALKFARYRQGNDEEDSITDYKRIENQQTVINALLDKLLTPASLLKIPEFVGIFTEYVHTDIKLEDIPYFADELFEVKGTDALETFTMPTTGTSGRPNYYELLDEEAILALVNQTINPFVKDLEAKDIDIIS